MDSSLEETSWLSEMASSLVEASTDSESLPSLVLEPVSDSTPDFAIETVTTHTCNAGFALVGIMTRTCMDDDQADIVGVWGGSAPTCERRHFN